jgi:hypothetical protein
LIFKKNESDESLLFFITIQSGTVSGEINCFQFKFIHVSSGFNAAVAGSFFAIETVLRPLSAENSPPFTTAMIILASVISSTVSNAVLGEKQAFTVPTYDLKSAAGILS